MFPKHCLVYKIESSLGEIKVWMKYEFIQNKQGGRIINKEIYVYKKQNKRFSCLSLSAHTAHPLSSCTDWCECDQAGVKSIAP